jgi:uncharacterized protein YciI
MLFAIYGHDAPGSLERRRASREAHLARVRQLQADGRLIIAGPHPAIPTAEPGDAGYTGSLIIAEFADLESARAWAQQDPYVAAGAWREVDVRPFVQVLP